MWRGSTPLTTRSRRAAAEALDILEKEKGITLLFTDVGLPDGMNGRQLAEEAVRRQPASPDRQGDSLTAELRAMYPKMPIVIASGYAEAELRARFSSDPLVTVLAKPYQARKLAAALQDAGIPAKW